MTVSGRGQLPFHGVHLPRAFAEGSLECEGQGIAVGAQLNPGFGRHGLNRPAIEHFHRDRTGLRQPQPDQPGFQLLDGRRGEPQELLGFRQWPEFQGHLGNDGQRSQGTDEQLAEVVASDVLDDASAGRERPSLAIHGRDPDDVIAKRAVSEPAGSGGVHGDGPAERGAAGIGDVDREALSFVCEHPLQFGDANARFDRDRQIAGGIVDDFVQLSCRNDPGPGRDRVARAKRCPSTRGNDSLPLAVALSARKRASSAVEAGTKSSVDMRRASETGRAKD